MRIGILTYWQTLDNYGQVLQCYALQQILKEMGHEPFVIRYDLYERPDGASYFRRLARKLLYPFYQHRQRRRRNARLAKAQLEKRRRFTDFREKYFCFSDCVYTSLKELRLDAPKADCYIAGSDQLWGQLLSNPENETFFLSFGEANTMRIAFAVSFGMKDYPVELCEKLHNNLMRFQHISCRERDGVDICKSVGVFAERVIDPTLVCQSSLYDKLIEHREWRKPNIFIYSMNIASSRDIRYDELKQFALERGWHIVVTTGSGYSEGRELYDNCEYSYATIEQWLSNIKNASLVVTSSFHGIVFCILFHRPFVYIPLTGTASKSNNRVLELLDDLELKEHTESCSASYEQLYRIPFDWCKVEQKLKQLRQEAQAFLRKSLYNVDS